MNTVIGMHLQPNFLDLIHKENSHPVSCPPTKKLKNNIINQMCVFEDSEKISFQNLVFIFSYFVFLSGFSSS